MSQDNQAKEYSIEEFEEALRENDEEKVVKIFEAYVTCDSPEWLNGYIPLCLALKYCKYEIADKFLESGFIKVNNDCQQKEYTPLHWAILNDPFTGYSCNVMDKLLEKGADVNRKNFLEQNAFDVALQIHNTSALWGLVRHGNDNNLKEETFFKALVDLINQNLSCHAEVLIKNCSYDINKFNIHLNLLFLAIKKKQYDLVKSLLERGIDVNYFNKFDSNSQTAIDWACEIGDLELVKLLLDGGASTDSVVYAKGIHKGSSPIHTAIENDHLVIVKEFLNRGVNINQILLFNGDEPRTPLHIACEQDNLKIAKLLIERGADLYFGHKTSDKYTGTPIIDAFYTDDGNIFAHIISLNNYRLTFNDAKKIAFFSSTADEDQSKQIELFFNYIDNLNPKDHLRYNLDVEVFNNSNLRQPVIHRAARYDKSKFIKFLIHSGSDVNLKNPKGRTALHVAFRYKKLRAIWCLIRRGADINLKSSDGYSPVSFMINNEIQKFRFETDDEDEDDKKGCNQNRNEWELEDIVNYYGYYVMKLKYLNLYVNDENYNFALSSFNLTDTFEYPDVYKEEVEKMKEEKISAELPDLTYYDFVKGSLNRRIHFINYQQILTVFDDEDGYFEKFPEFGPIISNLYYQALARKILLEKCDPYFVTLCPHLPYLCVKEIMSYFTNQDLRDLYNKFNFE